MIVNAQVVESNVRKIVGDRTFASIFADTMIGSLPVNKSEITPTENKQLVYYCKSVTEALGGYKALESAFDVENKTPLQNLFLAQLDNICTESADRVSRRINRRDADRFRLLKKEERMQALIDEANTKEDDVEDIVDDIANTDLEKIKEIISNKTINVIKDEKRAYEEEKQLDEQLREKLKDTDDKLMDEKNMDDDSANESDAVESYLNFIVGGTGAKHHVSVFSSLQNLAMECMECIPVAHGTDIFPIIYAVTRESFIPELPDIYKNDKVYEAMDDITPKGELVDSKIRPNVANLVAIVVYHTLETLKTMGIYSPSKGDVQKFVNRAKSAKDIDTTTKKIAMDGASKIVHEACMVDFSKLDNLRLNKIEKDLQRVVKYAEESYTKDPMNMDYVNLMTNAKRHINKITDVMKQRFLDSKQTPAKESFVIKHQKSNDIAQLNKIFSLYDKDPSIVEYRIELCSASNLPIRMLGVEGKEIKKSFINMEYACEASKYIDYLKEAFGNSKLSNTSKRVTINSGDGFGRLTELK